MDSATLNMAVQGYLSMVCWLGVLWVDTQGRHGRSVFSFLRNRRTDFYNGSAILYVHGQHVNSPFLTSWPAFAIVWALDGSDANQMYVLFVKDPLIVDEILFHGKEEWKSCDWLILADVRELAGEGWVDSFTSAGFVQWLIHVMACALLHSFLKVKYYFISW